MIIMKRRPWWVFILIFIASQLSVPVIVVGLSKLLDLSLPNSGSSIVIAMFLANVLAIVLWLLNRPQTVTWRSTMDGLRGENLRRTWQIILLAIPVTYLVNFIQEVFFPEIPDLVGIETMQSIIRHPLGMLTVALIGPLSEELLFRGGVQTDFYPRKKPQEEVQEEHSIGMTPEALAALTPEAQATPATAEVLQDAAEDSDAAEEAAGNKAGDMMKMWRPILLSALIFSLAHMNPAQMPVAFILGLLLGLAYWWTGSLAAAVCIHVINNSFACLLTLVSPNDDSLVSFVGGPVSAGILAVVCVFGIVVWKRATKLFP